MIKYLMILEGILSILYINKLFNVKKSEFFLLLIILLLYLSIKLAYYILIKRKFAKYLLIVLTLTITILTYSLFPPISYFLTISVCQLIFVFFKGRIYPAIISLGAAFIMPLEFVSEFIPICLLTFLVLLLIYGLGARQEMLSNENDRLKNSIQKVEKDVVLARQFDTTARYQSQLEQRNALAQKLHDELGHTLSGNTLQLEAIKLLMDKDTPKAKKLLETVISNLRDGTEAIRRILKDLKPETASMNISNIKTLISKTQDRSGILIDLIYESDVVELSNALWSVITQNIRECMTNLIRYSKASRCTIKFEALNKFYKVEIKDNGIGCLNVKQGLGLRGMEERAIALGGQIIIDGMSGFSIIMLFPQDKKMLKRED